MNGKVFLWLCLILFVVSCTPQVEPGPGGAPRVGKIVPEGEPVRIDLRPTTERIPNCSGSTTTISKNPAMTIVTSHSVEWEVGGQTGAGVTIGEGVVPFGVDLSSALTGSTAEGIDQGFSQSSSWNLSAAPGEIVEYTLTWWELWQPGYIDLTMADQTVIRVNARYRSGIQSDITTQIAYDCNGQVKRVVPEESNDSSLQPTETSSAELVPATNTVPSPSQPSTATPNSLQAVSCTGTGQLPSVLNAPAPGCVLIVEWWVGPNPTPCGIIISVNSVTVPDNAVGTWWYVNPDRPDAHIQGYRQKYDYCEVQDNR